MFQLTGMEDTRRVFPRSCICIHFLSHRVSLPTPVAPPSIDTLSTLLPINPLVFHLLELSCRQIENEPPKIGLYRLRDQRRLLQEVHALLNIVGERSTHLLSATEALVQPGGFALPVDLPKGEFVNFGLGRGCTLFQFFPHAGIFEHSCAAVCSLSVPGSTEHLVVLTCMLDNDGLGEVKEGINRKD